MSASQADATDEKGKEGERGAEGREAIPESRVNHAIITR